MIESLDFNSILLFLDSVFLQGDDGGIFGFFGQDRGALGSDDPLVKGLIPTMFAVTGFGILLSFFNSAVRKKMVDQTKLRRIMKETRAWQKERMAAMHSKDQAKAAELNKKSAYMNKMSLEMMPDEHETNDDYICPVNFDILFVITSTVLLHCSVVSHIVERDSWRFFPSYLHCRTSC